jgi:uncharacterized membrane protein
MLLLPPFNLPHTPAHIHPILVNFTAALVPASFFCDLLGRVRRSKSLTSAGWWMLLFAACITPFTGLAGLTWKRSVADMVPPEMLRTHQWLGITMAVVLLVLALWRGGFVRREQAPSVAYLAVAFIAVVALAYQGSLGGAMLFGP